MSYDFEGKVTQTITYHNAGGANQKTVYQKPVYDTQGRLHRVRHKIGTGAWQVMAQYEYNELGQVVDKKLHQKSDSSFMQSVDYRYTIRGWLKSINNAQLAVNSRNNDETNDYFGMEFLYDSLESGLNTKSYYNGNISAMKWKGAGDSVGTSGQSSYKFQYDATGKLRHANFNKYGTSWNQETSTLDESMKYDHNGNIVALQRNQNQRAQWIYHHQHGSDHGQSDVYLHIKLGSFSQSAGQGYGCFCDHQWIFGCEYFRCG